MGYWLLLLLLVSPLHATQFEEDNEAQYHRHHRHHRHHNTGARFSEHRAAHELFLQSSGLDVEYEETTGNWFTTKALWGLDGVILRLLVNKDAPLSASRGASASSGAFLETVEASSLRAIVTIDITAPVTSVEPDELSVSITQSAIVVKAGDRTYHLRDPIGQDGNVYVLASGLGYWDVLIFNKLVQTLRTRLTTIPKLAYVNAIDAEVDTNSPVGMVLVSVSDNKVYDRAAYDATLEEVYTELIASVDIPRDRVQLVVSTGKPLDANEIDVDWDAILAESTPSVGVEAVVDGGGEATKPKGNGGGKDQAEDPPADGAQFRQERKHQSHAHRRHHRHHHRRLRERLGHSHSPSLVELTPLEQEPEQPGAVVLQPLNADKESQAALVQTQSRQHLKSETGGLAVWKSYGRRDSQTSLVGGVAIGISTNYAYGTFGGFFVGTTPKTVDQLFAVTNQHVISGAAKGDPVCQTARVHRRSNYVRFMTAIRWQIINPSIATNNLYSGKAIATAPNHGFATNDYIAVTDSRPTGGLYAGAYNTNRALITVVDANTFTYTVPPQDQLLHLPYNDAEVLGGVAGHARISTTLANAVPDACLQMGTLTGNAVNNADYDYAVVEIDYAQVPYVKCDIGGGIGPITAPEAAPALDVLVRKFGSRTHLTNGKISAINLHAHNGGFRIVGEGGARQGNPPLGSLPSFANAFPAVVSEPGTEYQVIGDDNFGLHLRDFVLQFDYAKRKAKRVAQPVGKVACASKGLITFNAAHGLANGAKIRITAAAPAEYRGDFTAADLPVPSLVSMHFNLPKCPVAANPGAVVAEQLLPVQAATFEQAGKVIRVTTPAHGLAVGVTNMDISGFTGHSASLNGNRACTRTTATQFTFPMGVGMFFQMTDNGPVTLPAVGSAYVGKPLPQVNVLDTSNWKATVTSNAHRFVNGKTVHITGAKPIMYNGAFPINAAGDTFEYDLAVRPTASEGVPTPQARVIVERTATATCRAVVRATLTAGGAANLPKATLVTTAGGAVGYAKAAEKTLAASAGADFTYLGDCPASPDASGIAFTLTAIGANVLTVTLGGGGVVTVQTDGDHPFTDGQAVTLSNMAVPYAAGGVVTRVMGDNTRFTFPLGAPDAVLGAKLGLAAGARVATHTYGAPVALNAPTCATPRAVVTTNQDHHFQDGDLVDVWGAIEVDYNNNPNDPTTRRVVADVTAATPRVFSVPLVAALPIAALATGPVRVRRHSDWVDITGAAAQGALAADQVQRTWQFNAAGLRAAVGDGVEIHGYADEPAGFSGIYRLEGIAGGTFDMIRYGAAANVNAAPAAALNIVSPNPMVPNYGNANLQYHANLLTGAHQVTLSFVDADLCAFLADGDRLYVHEANGLTDVQKAAVKPMIGFKAYLAGSKVCAGGGMASTLEYMVAGAPTTAILNNAFFRVTVQPPVAAAAFQQIYLRQMVRLFELHGDSGSWVIDRNTVTPIGLVHAVNARELSRDEYPWLPRVGSVDWGFLDIFGVANSLGSVLAHANLNGGAYATCTSINHVQQPCAHVLGECRNRPWCESTGGLNCGAVNLPVAAAI